jgi:hypothetical protein
MNIKKHIFSFSLAFVGMLVFPQIGLGAACGQAIGSAPNGFGSAEDFFGSGNRLMTSVDCSGDEVTISASMGQNQIVYRGGYYLDGSNWREMRFTGGRALSANAAYAPWASGESAATVTPTSVRENGYYIFFACTYANDKWNCGCADKQCATPMWQIGRYVKGGGGGNNATGGKWVCDGSGYKFNPGHYLQFGKEVNPNNLRRSIENPGVAGALTKVSWATLEPRENQYDFSIIDNYLETLGGSDKQLIVLIFDRGSNTPSYIHNRGGTMKQQRGHEDVTLRIWEPWVMDRYLALVSEFAERYDDHPNFEGVMTWESIVGVTNGGGYSCDRLQAQLLRRTREAQGFFNHTVFWSSLTYGCTKEIGIQNNVDAMKEFGGGIAYPDAPPSRVLLGENVARRNKGEIPIFPNGDTTYYRPNVSLQDTYDYQEGIGATHIAWNTHFFQRDGDAARSMPFDQEVDQVIKNNPDMKNKACPQNMTCNTTDASKCR